MHHKQYDPFLLSDCPSKPQDPVCVISLYRYIKLHVLPEKSGKMKTTVKKNTTNPVYNEVLKVKRKMLVVMSVNLVLNYSINSSLSGFHSIT